MSVELKARGNYVVYTGKIQSVGDAFASIMSYLTVVYYWNNITSLYEIPTTMVPYGVYWIEVTQDCTWTYGVEETALNSVYLYAHINFVPYCGESVSPADALASILGYLEERSVYYFNNVTKEWDTVATLMGGVWYYFGLMVQNGVYALWPAQGCEWSFAEAFSGAISKKELEYNESRANIPASNTPLNERGLVHIWGHNDMSSNQKMGISWIVKDPDGVVVEEYSRWEAFWTGPGNAQEFIGGRFDLDKVGIYTLNVGLLMNPDGPIYVDIYYGSLCTVVTELVPAFSEFVVASFSKV